MELYETLSNMDEFSRTISALNTRSQVDQQLPSIDNCLSL